MAKAVSHSLNNCVNCLPGQKDVDVALKSIGESSKKLLVDSVRGSGLARGLGELGVRGIFALCGISEQLAFPLGALFLLLICLFLFGFLIREVPMWSFYSLLFL